MSTWPSRAVGLWLLCAALASAAAFSPPPAPTEWVTDTVGFVSSATRSQLNQRLKQYEAETGHQVIVWVGASTGGVPLEEWAVRTFEAWGIGRKGKDDGLALFVFAAERRLRIEVGYGLEGAIPDAIANRIIQEEAVPRLRAGQNDAAIVASIDAALSVLGGEAGAPPRKMSASGRPLSLVQLVIFGILGLMLLVFVVTNPSLALLFLVQLVSHNRRGGPFGGGGGFGGGGFGGGGGRSGGGGASGSW